MNKIAKLWGFLAIGLFAACEPIENRNELTGELSPEDIDISVTVDGNTITMENRTPGIIPYWDYGTGFSNKQKVSVLQPFAGDHIVKFTAYGVGYEGVSVERTVHIENNDDEYFNTPESWNLLTDNGKGKTWVWNLEKNNPYGNGSEMMKDVEWWGPGVEAMKEDGSAYDELYFDLQGAANYKLIHKKADGTVLSEEKAFFNTFTTTYSNQTFNQVEIVGGKISKGTENGLTYDIVTLNEDELVLRERHSGFAWIFFFKAKK
mgnify:CR=1 FL=1